MGATLEAAVNILLQRGTKSPLHSLDALPIALAQAAGSDDLTFVTADANLFAVASEVFPHVMNPETVG